MGQSHLSEGMKVALTIPAMKEIRGELPQPVGFVPTMGYLHEGHLSLVRRARGENRSVVVSIFVNPTQFAPQEDFETYPRDTERDLTLLRREGVNIVFLPAAGEMYPPNFNSWVVVEGITEILEGASRPGHFRGVTTVVAMLLNIVEPARVYFGQKDAQQSLVIKKMVADLNMNPQIIVAPTLRESDGLAMSSRNVHLDPEERQAALVLWKSLCLAQQLWSGGERSADRIRRQMIALIEGEPGARIDYVSVADPESLRELSESRESRVKSQESRGEGLQLTGKMPVLPDSRLQTPERSVSGLTALVSLAVWIGKTRLIDNVVLGGAA
ncbi:MAG: Pantothenate synthetase [Dehalococcoidia bacterium]|nr:Pantothenate synthetase [Chloroflexota bacterium]MBT9162330.1 Pantothenate synthetase [Chloroflexota bacterium]